MLTWECYSFNRGDAGFSSQICISISIRNNHFIHTSQPYNTNQKQSSTRPRLDGKAKTAKLVRKTEHKLFLRQHSASINEFNTILQKVQKCPFLCQHISLVDVGGGTGAIINMIVSKVSQYQGFLTSNFTLTFLLVFQKPTLFL
ncbi:uncharacterized protein LOC106769995 isoform X1 [Vigna radiata var. radiata]|uniref:Uncharacterized protein LOC106769995 isoform X1 n=1 Tax=Vigna radiata var. radiata TaxID=3916 RepID=A0A3Q0FA62_VIGRR|nr:uncharacterized protein LOC106769995 isoform X1 [Vigna radiata var. radiata]